MIIILTQCFPTRIGGIENLIFNLSYFLSKNNKVIVLADQHDVINDTIFDNKFKDKFLVRRFSGIKYFRKRNKVRELEKIIDFQNVKVIISDSWKSFEIPIKKLQKKKIYSMCLTHGNELIVKNKKHHKRILNTLKNVDKIISNSKYTKGLVQKISPDLKEIEVIYPGASDFTSIDEEEIKLIEGKPTLLTIARLEKRKGHKNILFAISKLKKKYPDIRYIVAGDGEEKHNLKLIVDKLNISKNVIFIGSVSESQKKYIFSKTDLMVMPTIDETNNLSIEGFGISYIEAALFGIPSIASNVGGTKEAVLHNQTGIILNNFDNLENTIEELIEDTKKRVLFGENAKHRALTELNWNNQIKKYLNLISFLSQ